MTEIYCSKCGEKNSPTKDYCIKCGSILRKLDNFKVGDKITSFEDMFTQKHKEQLNEIPLTNEIYELILNNIYETGKKSLKNKGSTALEKVADVVEAYAKWSYKSKGGELGFYSANNIKLDDRLNDSVQIATLIHELSHHLLAEIHEQILMYFWEVEKTYEIEVFVQYILASGTVHLMNEYCAHTVEGRFIPHGYQNYGSFNSILEEQKDELDHDTVVISLVLGNTIAEDIIHLLEHFIDEDLRHEIKQQYNKDQLPPSYSQIGMETTDMMDGNSHYKNTSAVHHAVILKIEKTRSLDEILQSGEYKKKIGDYQIVEYNYMGDMESALVEDSRGKKWIMSGDGFTSV